MLLIYIGSDLVTPDFQTLLRRFKYLPSVKVLTESKSYIKPNPVLLLIYIGSDFHRSATPALDSSADSNIIKTDPTLLFI